MSTDHTPTIRIGLFGVDPSESQKLNRHVDLWSVGYGGSITHAEAVPVELCAPNRGRTWDDILEEIDGVLYLGFPEGDLRNFHGNSLCHWCREHKMPLLAIDDGMLQLNTSFGGASFDDLPRQFPEALQHRAQPEEDVRHGVEIILDTKLCKTYGDGEIIVNSLHRTAIDRLARGFRVGGRALDGVIEAIEWEDEDWFAMGIQWQPASSTASGLDIQIFRALVAAGQEYANAHFDTREFAAAA